MFLENLLKRRIQRTRKWTGLPANAPVLALIVRAADTDRFEMAPQAAGLWAISAGLSHTIADDHQMLEVGLKVYDALYAWSKYLQKEKHVWKP